MARWERGEPLGERALAELSQDFGSLLDAELEEIARQAESGKAGQALGRLSTLSAFASAAAAQRPSLIGTLGERVEQFRAALSAVANVSGAVEFSVTFGIPSGISVSLMFKVS